MKIQYDIYLQMIHLEKKAFPISVKTISKSVTRPIDMSSATAQGMATIVQSTNGSVFPCTGPTVRQRRGEMWACIFDQLAAKILGFDANTYTGMTSDADRYVSLSLLRGARVMDTIKKCVKDTYVNYTVSEMEVVDS